MTNRRNFIRNSALTAAGISFLKTNALASVIGENGLKDFFKNDFLVGTAVSDRVFTQNDLSAKKLITREFNVLTPENCLKWEPVHPGENRWDFAAGDRLSNFARENNMAVQGHVLVWHSQVPDSLFQDDTGQPLSKEALTRRMQMHIQTLVDRYKASIASWDVVNEAITPEDGLRKSKWLEIMGPDFMEKAFHFAHEADPHCQLLYNDYGMDNPRRREFVVDLISRFKRKGVPIHGIGMQGHFNLREPEISEIEASIEAFAATGLRIHFTEVDVDVLPYNWSRSAEVSTNAAYRESLNPYKTGLPPEIETQLTRRYEALFKLFIKHRDKIDRVTFWGPSDDYSWKNNFPVRGRTNYPLLFDRQHNRKEAYYAVVGLKK